MPALQSIVVTDRATTPVNHTLVPRELNSSASGANVAMLSKVSDGLPPSAQMRLTLSNSRRNGKLKGVLRISVPIVQSETVNGVSSWKIIRINYIEANCTFDENSTEQERNDLVGLLVSALAPSKALTHDTLVKGETVWG